MPNNGQNVSNSIKNARTYKDSENRVPVNVRKKIMELDQEDHISTKRPQ